MPKAKCLSLCADQEDTHGSWEMATMGMGVEIMWRKSRKRANQSEWRHQLECEVHAHIHIFLLKFSKWSYDTIKQSHNTKQGCVYDVAQHIKSIHTQKHTPARPHAMTDTRTYQRCGK